MSEFAGWRPAPFGRHEHRYWNGSAWTEHVSDSGVTGTDEPIPSPAGAPPPPPPPPHAAAPSPAARGATPPPAPSAAGGRAAGASWWWRLAGQAEGGHRARQGAGRE